LKSKKVSIIGFGFSGLSSAWAFHRQGYDVEVFEKRDQIGGLLQTSSTEYGLIESAANAILKSKTVDEMANDFGLKWAARKKTIKYKWVFTDQPRRWPLSVMQTLKILKPLTGLAFANPKLKPMAGETVSDWGVRVFKTPSFVNQLLGPALQGVYAQGPDNLSASLSLKSLFDQQRVKTEGSFAPENGMADFFNLGLKYFDTKSNFKLHLNSSKEPKDLDAELIIDTRPDYKAVKYLSVTSVTLIFNEQDRPKFQGFGCLFAGEKKNLGVLFNSDIFEGRSKEGLFSETWIVAEDYKDDRETVDDVLNFRQKAFKISASPVFYKVSPWPLGIPNYDIAHERFLQNNFKVETSLQDRKLIKIANYTGDIGLNKILEKITRRGMEKQI
jgi:protoporphyrinogen oxidase